MRFDDKNRSRSLMHIFKWAASICPFHLSLSFKLDVLWQQKHLTCYFSKWAQFHFPFQRNRRVWKQPEKKGSLKLQMRPELKLWVWGDKAQENRAAFGRMKEPVFRSVWEENAHLSWTPRNCRRRWFSGCRTWAWCWAEASGSCWWCSVRI